MVFRTAIAVFLVGAGALSLLAGCGLDRNGLQFGDGFGTSSTTGRGFSIANGSSTASSSGSSAGGSSSNGSSGGAQSTGNVSSGSSSQNGGSDGDAGLNEDAADAAPPIDDAGDPCSGGWVGVASDGGGASASVGVLFGRVGFSVTAGDAVTGLHTTLTVPAEPTATGSLQLFPSLTPNLVSTSANVADLGALQPTLSWGPTCAPSSPNDAYASWWASANYVDNDLVGSSVCQGGSGIDTKVGDDLAIDLSLQGTGWTESITDIRTGRVATFNLDLGGVAEVFPTFVIAPNGQSPVSDIVFSSTTITLADDDPTACQPVVRGPTDAFSTPEASSDGKTCCISRIVLRALGVPATTAF